MHKILWKVGGIVAAVVASGLARKGVDKLHDRFDPEIDQDDIVVKPGDAPDGEDAAAAADEEPETDTGEEDDEPDG